MGLHRNVIHPKFGSFVLLGTVLTAAEIRGEPPRLDFDPRRGPVLAVLAGRLKIRGDRSLLDRFAACFPR